ncbi:MAG: c-type cytochrome [Planctomycetales bacterium]|nr:c-type cytochrome [Planctomycetales bacterium]
MRIYLFFSFQCVLTLLALLGSGRLGAQDGNRLTYLDDFANPYYAGREFPKLVTPQWVGEAGVEAVVTLGIDDMREVEKYEAYLRPILERLKAIDGRAALSIMTCQIDPQHPHLQKWLQEGVSLEAHTADHPCPCLQSGNFAQAKDTYDRCVDQLFAIPNHRPVAFRFPCCDSLNTPSPRAFAEIVNRTTPAGNFLQLSTSVCALLTADDPELPRDLILDRDGKPRFSRYVPFPSFVNKVENYPYPFVIDRLCWEFPFSVPDDWQGFNLQGANNPKTVEDLQAVIEATVLKRGVANLVFHPHGWIRNDQMVAVIDHVVQQHGAKVKFLNFAECIQRLTTHLLAGQPLRDDRGGDNGVRILDVNDDGYLDVLIGNEERQQTRIWLPQQNQWQESSFPVQLVDVDGQGRHVSAGVHFGVLAGEGTTSLLVRSEHIAGLWHFDGQRWSEDPQGLVGLQLDGQPLFTVRQGVDQGLRLRDVDGDGRCEVVVGNPQQQAVFRWSPRAKSWQQLPFTLPPHATIVDAQGGDQGLRFVDVDEDGRDDILFSNKWNYGLYLFDSLETGWSRERRSGQGGGVGAIPMIARGGKSNGAWIAQRHLWLQNEDTHRLPDGVDRRSFADLLGSQAAQPKSPQAALRGIQVPEGYRVELVAAEPLVRDPVALDWGADGRLWVVEMADYPLGLDGKSTPGGRVRWLEDRDGDGVYDHSTLFLDKLSTPNGIMVWNKGVLISAAPDILYAEDTTGDGRGDRVEVLYTGFGQGNQQHRANGFCWGLDNWVHLANGDSNGTIVSTQTGQQVDIRSRDLRIRPDEGRLEATAGMTQYGRSRDDWGNWFGCNNPNPIFHFVLDERYLRRNPHFSPPASRNDIRQGGQLVYPISPDISHCDTQYRPLGAPTLFTACCSTIVYRDNLFGPAVSNHTFTSEPVYNLVHRRVLEPQGVTFRSVRPSEEQTTEFFRSSDPWCRPTGLRVGPDGALYIADMYRTVIEHPQWIDDELEKEIDVRGGEDRGRIYRVAPVGLPPRPVPRLDGLSTYALVAALDSPSGWQRDLVHRMLLWREDPAAVEPLQDLLLHCPRAQTRLHALCTLDGLHALSPQILEKALADAEPAVQRHAIRLIESLSSGPVGGSLLALLEPLRERAALPPLVQLQLAYTLGESSEAAFAGQWLGQLLLDHADSPYLQAAISSSLNADNIEFALQTILAAAGDREKARRQIDQLLSLSVALGADRAVSLAFESFGSPSQGRYSQAQLATLDQLLSALESRNESTARFLNTAQQARVAAALQQAREMVLDSSLETTSRAAAVLLLGRDASMLAADLQRLSELLGPRQAPELQRAALQALARLSDARIPDLLLPNWNRFSPAVRAGALELLLSRTASTQALLAGMEAGQVPVGQIEAAQRDRLLNHKEATIRQRAQQLFSQPTSSDRKEVIERFRHTLELTADATQGKIVFAQRCAACHQLDGIGQRVGPDFSSIKDRSPEAMLTAILDPNRAVEDKYIAYNVLTTDDRVLTGVLTEESGNQITLSDASGKQHNILRNQIEELRATSRSLMPEGLELDLSPQDLANLLHYLSVAGGTSPKE